MLHVPFFNSVEEELAYYKARAETMQQALEETSQALEDYQLSSKELEEELEREIDTTEKRYNEIKLRNEALRTEVDDWKEKYHQSKKEQNDHIIQLSRELENLRRLAEEFKVKERALEQDNDDLERTERAARWSLQELETKYGRAIERQAMLENELEAKSKLDIEVQRLKDELRDANCELTVLRSKPAPSPEPSTNATTVENTISNRSTSSVSSLGGSTSSLTSPPSARTPRDFGSHEVMPSLRAKLARNSHLYRTGSNGSTASLAAAAASRRLSGSSGITPATAGILRDPNQNPVKMVQEMVGRVKSLEARLVSCRSLVTPLLQPPPSYSTAATPPSSNRNSLNGSTGSLTSSHGTGSSPSNSRPASPQYSPLSSSKVGRRTSLLQQQRAGLAAANGTIAT
ncbi:NADH:ubiquinone oxidoreductase [Actinomortierella ambigua]|nr:NADH:ubiquinone oxidoreductase [Actinomortierella ambigua]